MSRKYRWVFLGLLALAQVGIIVCYVGMLRGTSTAAAASPMPPAAEEATVPADPVPADQPQEPVSVAAADAVPATPAPFATLPAPQVANDAALPAPPPPPAVKLDVPATKDAPAPAAAAKEESASSKPVEPLLPALKSDVSLQGKPLPPPASPSGPPMPAPAAAPPPAALAEGPPPPLPGPTPPPPPSPAETKPAAVPPPPPTVDKAPAPVPSVTAPIPSPEKAAKVPEPTPPPPVGSSAPPDKPAVAIPAPPAPPAPPGGSGIAPVPPEPTGAATPPPSPEVPTARVDNPPAPCPWTLRMSIVKGRTQLEARIGKEVQFRVDCAQLSIGAPTGCLTARGDVHVTGSDLDGTCDGLTINWQDDHVLLDGKAHLKCLRNGQDVELNSEHLSLRLSTSSSVKGTGNSRKAPARPDSSAEESEDTDLK